MEKENFIMVHNNLIKEKSTKHLSIEELYLYCYLYMDLYYSGSMKSTISLISLFIPINYNKKKEDNLKAIKENLLSLQNKKLITIVNHDGEKINSKLRANDGIMIHLLENETVAFTMIKNEKFLEFESMKYFYIYTLVARWNMSMEGYFECDYDRWARLLGCSRNTAIKYIDEAVSKKIIFRNTGDYTEEQAANRKQKIQSLNQYKVVPFSEEEKTRITKKIEYLDQKESKEVKEEVDVNISAQKEPLVKLPVNLGEMF